MAESAISFLFNELSILLHEEQSLLGGLGQDAEFIREEVGKLRAFLRVADAQEESDSQLREWVKQVRDIAYDTEDVLDRYMLRFAHRDAHGFRGYLKKVYASMKNLKARHQIASEIKRIRFRLENASMSQQTYRDKYPIMFPRSSSNLSRNTSYDGRGDALLLEEIDVVGIEKPKKQLLEWLSSTGYGLKVISVVGMAGLGKTTLVKKVYDDSSLKMNFDNHAWITVSESFKVGDLLEDIIKRLVEEVKLPPPPGFGTMNDDDKREFIYKFLQNKNYIIVLDDVWRINAWEAVRYAFPKNTTRGWGCIIITTRFSNIGNAACSETNGHVYKLEPLPEEESKVLFYRKAFPRNSCAPYLKEISENILKRCKGWPLAIVVVGGLLATKNNRLEEWEMFNRSLGSELAGDNLKRMSKLLSLSFYDLPYYLKACFLYLSIFPEDQVIEKATIIRLWTAEGFVEAKQGKTIEEIAEGYLNELVNRSLIQVIRTSCDGRPRNFYIHDLVREYVISKAREHTIVNVDNGGEMQWADRIRRLALHNSVNCTLINSSEHLRSLLLLGLVDLVLGPILYKVLGGGCRMLKVLDLRGAQLETIPNEVFKLYHLKYLGLRDTQVRVIPKSIGNLEKLETLDLKRSMVTELPIEILKLQRLRNLLVYRYKFENEGYHLFDIYVQSFKAPYEMGKLACLQKLCYVDADTKIVKEIGKLSKLQRLGITKLRREDGEDLCSSLAKLTNLRSLNIVSFAEGELMNLEYPLSSSTFPFLRTLELRGRLEKVPQWIPSLNALSKIYLGWSRLREDPLECLECLPNLQVLNMDCAYEGQGLSFKAGGFQRLRELRLYLLRELRWVRVEKGSMPLLQHLEVGNCESMVGVPVGIEHLTDLQYVYFLDMADEFVGRVSDEKRKQGNHWNLASIWSLNWLNGKWVKTRL